MAGQDRDGPLRPPFAGFSSRRSPYTFGLGLGLMLEGAFIAGFAKLASELLGNDLGRFDSTVAALVGRLAHPALTPFMRFLTWLGAAPAVAALTVTLSWALWRRYGRSREALTLLASVAGAAVLDTVLKDTFGRTRPPGPWLARASGFSFPSGHSMVGFALYGYLAYLTWRGGQRSWRRLLLAGALVAVAVLIGVSRIYLGVHYPSDVVAGFAAGGAWVTACTLIGHCGLRKRSPAGRRLPA